MEQQQVAQLWFVAAAVWWIGGDNEMVENYSRSLSSSSSSVAVKKAMWKRMEPEQAQGTHQHNILYQY